MQKWVKIVGKKSALMHYYLASKLADIDWCQYLEEPSWFRGPSSRNGR